MEAFQNLIFLRFFFASFDSSKAFIGCLEKVQTFAKRFCL